MAYRHDLVEIKSPHIDQNGYLVADAFPTKVGVFKYVKPDGSITCELRHEDDVFKPESLESLKHRPIVDEHPQGAMHAGNTRGLSAGHVGESVERQGDHVKANVIVTDAGLIAKMQGKGGHRKRELSCGYTADVIAETGTYKGEQYDHRQTNIVYNHLASVHKGRAGPTAQIHLDAEDAVSEIFELMLKSDPITEPGDPKLDGDKPMTIKIKLPAVGIGTAESGTLYRADAMEITYDEKAESTVKVLTDRLDAAHAQIAAVTDKYDQVHKEKKKAEGERDQAVEDKKKATSDHAQLDALADVRADVKGVAAHLGVKEYADKSNDQIKAMIVAHHNPDLDVTKLDAGNIEGRYGMICDGIKVENKGLESLAALKAATGPVNKSDAGNPDNDKSPREKYIQDVSGMHGKTEDQLKKDWAN